MNYDQALNLVFNTGFTDSDYVKTEDIVDALTPYAEDIELRDQANGSRMLIILIPVVGGYAEIKLKTFMDRFLGYLVSKWYDDDFISDEDDDVHYVGQGMYESSDQIKVFPHFPPGRFYRDKVGRLMDDEGHILKEMDGIAFDDDGNVIGYDPKVYPIAPTSEQIQQTKLNIFTDEMMNAHDIIRNYEPVTPLKIIRSKRKINQIGSRHVPSEWEIDEYIRNYKGPGS